MCDCGGVSTVSVVVVVVFIYLAGLLDVSQAQLIGHVTMCKKGDGEEVYIPGITDGPCISCFCQNKTVECFREKCPSSEGCHMLLYEKPEGTCCHTCKGCWFNGRQYASGQSWLDKSDHCQAHTCHAGVVTTSAMQCRTPCENPTTVPGQCCPVCQGCKVGNKTYNEGDTFHAPDDACAACTCQGGKVVCEKQACPVLNCPISKLTAAAQHCCPVCSGSRKVFSPPRRCLFRNKVYQIGQGLDADSCTTCTCKSNGTMYCSRPTCPRLRCPLSHVVQDMGLCCPRCVRPKKTCRYDGRVYKHAKTWEVDLCRSCVCDDGTTRCQSTKCSNDVACGKNMKLKAVDGHCCPQCVDDGAMCAVFGDPHYRSFDARIYNFQGTCNYILAQDCHGYDFSIRVRNDARLSNQFAWTKTVTILVRNTKIYLLQKMRVKINRKRVSLPYQKSPYFSITQESHSITLKLTSGVRVLWDGDSYVEVYVPPFYKHKMCGLCGNYNNNENDDFRGKDGTYYFEAKDFAQTWEIGGRKPCNRKKSGKSTESPCLQDKTHRRRARKDCRALLEPVFAECRTEVEVQPYYESCLIDMCDCPADRECVCESLTAYGRACERAGHSVEWRRPDLCGVPSCPKYAVWSPCVSACPRTCENLQDLNFVCKKQCVVGCACPTGKVLYKNRCVRQERCPELLQADQQHTKTDNNKSDENKNEKVKNDKNNDKNKNKNKKGKRRKTQNKNSRRKDKKRENGPDVLIHD